MPSDTREGPFDLLSVCLAPGFQHTLVFERLVPGAVNRAAESRLDASGKGVNACRALVMAGGSAVHATHSGGPLAPLFAELCALGGIELSAVPASAGLRTCVTAIDRSSLAATELVEECPAVGPETWPLLLERIESLLPRARVVLYSGKRASGYPESAAAEIARLCRRSGLPFVMDGRGGELMAALAERPLVCKPNAEEFAATFGCSADEAPLADEAARLSAETGAAFLVTRGHERAVLASGGRASFLPVRAVASPLNPIGSGDACAGGICLELARGASVEEAAAFGLELATRSVMALAPGAIG